MQPFWISLLLAGSAAATPLANGVAERGLSSYEGSSLEPAKSQLEARKADNLWYRAECWDATESANSFGRSKIIRTFKYNTWLSKATCEKVKYTWHPSGSCIRDVGAGNSWIDGPQWWDDCKAVAEAGYTDYRHPAGNDKIWEEYQRVIDPNLVEGRAWDEARGAPGT